jgi:hypothetical protein
VELLGITEENIFERCVIGNATNTDKKAGVVDGPHKVATLLKYIKNPLPKKGELVVYSEYPVENLTLDQFHNLLKSY